MDTKAAEDVQAIWDQTSLYHVPRLYLNSWIQVVLLFSMVAARQQSCANLGSSREL